MADQKKYWDSNLDPQNLEHKERFQLNREIAFLIGPDQKYAYCMLEPLKEHLILEIGSGLGANAIELARRGAKVIAFDLSGERLRELKSHIESLNLSDRILLVQGSADSLPFKTSSIDRVYTKSVLIHTQLTQTTEQINRVLKADGRGVFIEPLQKNPWVNLYRATFAPKIWRVIANYFGPAESAMMQTNFTNVIQRDFYFLGFFAFIFQYALPNVTLFRLSSKLLYLLDRVLFQIIPPLRNMAWMRVFRVEKKNRKGE